MIYGSICVCGTYFASMLENAWETIVAKGNGLITGQQIRSC